MEGRLQICMGGTWGSVCDSSDSWGTEETAVACQRLGFSAKGWHVDCEATKSQGTAQGQNAAWE